MFSILTGIFNKWTLIIIGVLLLAIAGAGYYIKVQNKEIIQLNKDKAIVEEKLKNQINEFILLKKSNQISEEILANVLNKNKTDETQINTLKKKQATTEQTIINKYKPLDKTPENQEAMFLELSHTRITGLWEQFCFYVPTHSDCIK